MLEQAGSELDLLVRRRLTADPDFALDLPPRSQHQLAGLRKLVGESMDISGITEGDQEERITGRRERESAVGPGRDLRDIRPAIELPGLHQVAHRACVDHDLGPRGGLAIGEQDDSGKLRLAAPEGEVERLAPFRRPEGARGGRLVTRGLDPDEEGFAGHVEPGRVSTARDLHRFILGPVGLLPPLVLLAPDQAELRQRPAGLGVGHAGR